MAAELFVGLMSGTSMDAIDAVLVEFDDANCSLRASHSAPYDPSLGRRLRALASAPDTATLDDLGSLDVRVARAFAEATTALMNKAGIGPREIMAIGSHGQTVLHRPDATHPFSLQLGDPGTLAATTGLTVVADFRNADIAVGGQGAPLVPAFHRWAFGDPTECRAVVNIGGIANVTRLGQRGETTGYDTGPGNVLLDQWCREHRGTEQDTDGTWAASGNVRADLLARLLDDAYFARPPPKSTGTDYFNLDWLRRRLGQRLSATVDPADLQATLSELTAISIAEGVGDAHTIAVCGGGVLNRDLMDRLERLLRPRQVGPTSDLGIDPEWVEAIAFAWLARQRLRGEASNVPAVTGASAAISLGGIYLPPVTVRVPSRIMQNADQ